MAVTICVVAARDDLCRGRVTIRVVAAAQIRVVAAAQRSASWPQRDDPRRGRGATIRVVATAATRPRKLAFLTAGPRGPAGFSRRFSENARAQDQAKFGALLSLAPALVLVFVASVVPGGKRCLVGAPEGVPAVSEDVEERLPSIHEDATAHHAIAVPDVDDAEEEDLEAVVVANMEHARPPRGKQSFEMRTRRAGS